jgi:putative inorganic carbon (hco3(-)) transporter
MSSGPRIPVNEFGSFGLPTIGRSAEWRSSNRAADTIAYAGLLLFCLVNFLQPGEWIAGASDLALGKIAACIALIAFAASVIPSPGKLFHLPRQVRWVVLLWLQCALAVYFAYRQKNSVHEIGDFLKVVLILIVMVVASNTLSRVRTIISMQVISSIAFAIVTLRGYTGGRAKGAVTLLRNPNDLALALVIAIPLCAYLLLSTKRLTVKVVCMAAIGLMSYCVILTYSRGGFLAMVAAYAVMAFCFGFREKRHAFLVIPVLVTVFLVSFSPSHYGRRLDSIMHPNMDDGSYVARQDLLSRSITVTSQHPLLGIGPGNFAHTSRDQHVTHNTYTQLSAEAGIPALALFLLAFWATFKGLRNVRKDRNESVRLLAAGLTASIAGALVACLFGSYAYDFTLYYLVAYASCLQTFAGNVGSERWHAAPQSAINRHP